MNAPSSYTDDQLIDLLDRRHAGTAEAAEIAALEGAIQADPLLRRRVLDWQHLEAALAWELASGNLAPPLPELTDAPAESDNKPTLAAEVVALPKRLFPMIHSAQSVSLIAASLVVTIIVLSLALATVSNDPQPLPERPTAAYAGMLRDARGAEWNLEEGESVPKELAPGETLELVAGFAELELMQGTRIIVEAPARLTVESGNALAVDYGAITCRVPAAAVGFRVTTESVEVVDRGTEFSLLVSRDHSTDIRVFNGAVDAFPTAAAPGSPGIRLTRNDALRFEPGSAAALPSATVAARFSRSLRSTTHSYRLEPSGKIVRLSDSDRDGRGDGLQSRGNAWAAGEKNSDRPHEDVGRVWIPFRLSPSDLHHAARAEQVVCVFSIREVQGKSLDLAAYGVPLDSTGAPQADDYQRPGERLEGNLLARLRGGSGKIAVDVTPFVRVQAASGEAHFAIRLQIDAPRLPNDDDRVENVIVFVHEKDAPQLLLRVPRREVVE